MLELLADAGPMALPIWAVLLWSVAMYPLGFLFGACSDCCTGCGPCDYCTGPYMAENACENGYVSVSANGQTASRTFEPGNIDQTDFITLATYDCDGLTYALQTFLYSDMGDGTDDECACRQCGIQFTLYGGVTTDEQCRWYFGGRNPVAGGDDGNFFDPCAVESVSGTYTLTAQAQYEAFYTCLLCGEEDVAPPCCDTLSVDDFSDVVITLTAGEFAVSECECGACCTTAGDCIGNVTQFYCEEAFEGPSGTWQGVGTDCDPNPCPPRGACCYILLGESYCDQLTEYDCDAIDGTWQAGSCDPNPC